MGNTTETPYTPEEEHLIRTKRYSTNVLVEKVDGYGYALVAANSLTELIDHMQPGYAQVPDGDAYEYRYIKLLNLLNIMQEAENNEATQNGFNIEQLTENELQPLLQSREHPNNWPLRWEHPVTLHLLVTPFQPYGPAPRPVGNTKFYDPTSELDYLSALAELGAITPLCENPNYEDN